MISRPYSDPVLSSREAIEFEGKFFGGDEKCEWMAMSQAGAAIAKQVALDIQETLGEEPMKRLLVLVGKGHNGGDALIAARHLLTRYSGAEAFMVFPFGMSRIRPLVKRSLDDLQSAAGYRLKYLSLRASGIGAQMGGFCADEVFDLCLDGMLGMQFQPPVRAPARALIQWVNNYSRIRCRVAVDVPSGVGDSSDDVSFRADFSYATGIAKSGLFSLDNKAAVGRIRYLDLGFFDGCDIETKSTIVAERVMGFRRRLRGSAVHKKSFGHLFVVGGSSTMPGAILMTVRSALMSGVGLVTAFVPESIVAAAAVHLPEAMWVGLPEIPDDGGLALEGISQVRALAKGATGWAIGPGVGRHPETATLIEEILKLSSVPVLLDADALQAKLVASIVSKRSAVITPHAGEFNRLNDRPLNEPIDVDRVKAFAEVQQKVVLLKGAHTLITDGVCAIFSTCGGPVLARGGSGDILSGLIGGRISIPNTDFIESIVEGATWHGWAADRLARVSGQNSCKTTDILSFL